MLSLPWTHLQHLKQEPLYPFLRFCYFDCKCAKQNHHHRLEQKQKQVAPIIINAPPPRSLKSTSNTPRQSCEEAKRCNRRYDDAQYCDANQNTTETVGPENMLDIDKILRMNKVLVRGKILLVGEPGAVGVGMVASVVLRWCWAKRWMWVRCKC